MGSDPQYAKWPLLPLSQHVFTLTNGYASNAVQQAAVKILQDAIVEDKMAPFYRYLAHPIEGVLNAVGESGASAPGKPSSRKSSLVGMVASKASTTHITLPWDEALYEKLKADNEEELAGFQKEEDEAVEKAGDTEVMAAKGKKAELWARVGDKVCALFVPGVIKQREISTFGEASEKEWNTNRKPNPTGQSNCRLRGRV